MQRLPQSEKDSWKRKRKIGRISKLNKKRKIK